MNIAVIEIDQKNHVSMIYNYVYISNINNWSITIFASVEIYNLIKKDLQNYEYKIVLKKEQESVFVFLLRAQVHMIRDSVNIVFILTLQSYFTEFLFSPFWRVKKIITIHNANTWINGNVIRSKKHILKRFFRKVWLHRTDGVIVNSSNMFNFLKINNFSKPLGIMPFSLKRTSNIKIYDKQKSNNLTIVYPGMVDSERKNYHEFLKLAHRYPTIKFVLLGKLNRTTNKNIIDEINKNVNDNVLFFEDFVSPDTFQEILLEADCLFSDLVTSFNISDYSEVYGATKDSGISYLMQEFSIPCMLNKTFKNIEHLNVGTIYFSEIEEIYTKLDNINIFINELELLRLQLEKSISSIVKFDNIALNLASVVERIM